MPVRAAMSMAAGVLMSVAARTVLPMTSGLPVGGTMLPMIATHLDRGAIRLIRCVCDSKPGRSQQCAANQKSS